MASRGKRKRSLAAKRGWETRRKNAQRIVMRDKGRKADRKDPLSRAVQDESMRTMMTEAGLKVPKRISHTRLLEQFLDFVGHQRQELREAVHVRLPREVAARARAEEEIKKQEQLMPMVANRAIAETVARFHELTGEGPEGWIEDEYLLIRSRMSMAAEFGDPSEEAERLADQYEMSPREIFTIWLSP